VWDGTRQMGLGDKTQRQHIENSIGLDSNRYSI